jgi:hypothetical protein
MCKGIKMFRVKHPQTVVRSQVIVIVQTTVEHICIKSLKLALSKNHQANSVIIMISKSNLDKAPSEKYADAPTK